MRSRVMGRGAVALCAIVVLARASGAQGYVHLPNGGLGYITDYTTTGFFQCGNPFYTLGTCSASGNVMTLGHGGNAITLTFHGISQTITAGKSQRVSMGRITKTFSGPGPYTFPATKSRHVAMFHFSIILNTTFPLVASDALVRGYAGTSPTAISPTNFRGVSNYAWFPVTPSPPPFDYHEVIFYDFSGATLTAGPEAIDIFASVALTPEPATIWLTGTGMLGLLAVARGRRRSQRELRHALD